MAFPTATVVNSRQNTMSTSHPVTIPSGLTPGSVLLFVEFSHNNFDFGGHPEGMSRLYRAPASPASGNVFIDIWGYRYLAALLPILGVERRRPIVPGGVVTLTSNSNRKSDIYAIAFNEKDLPLSYFQFAQSSGGATAIDPPNLTYSASAKDVMWWALGVGIGFQVGDRPANYTLHEDGFFFTGTSVPSTWGSGIGARELNAASENPGAFPGVGPTSDWHAVTMGIALDGP